MYTPMLKKMKFRMIRKYTLMNVIRNFKMFMKYCLRMVASMPKLLRVQSRRRRELKKTINPLLPNVKLKTLKRNC